MVYSKYLTPRAYQGLLRLGDVLLPGTAHMPRFSSTHSSEHVDEVLRATADKDREDLVLVLSLFSVLPIGLVGFLLRYASKVSSAPIVPTPLVSGLHSMRTWWKTQWRLLDLGLRGVVFSVYYSGLNNGLSQTPNVHRQMDYQLACLPERAEQSIRATD
ncbi:hypothetical protein [uncultured Shewanella sp.]|uniref:hypothetical protein n=1 Tax=uncultured Shewanella sp. TaxID=173975 RepID=UPI00262BBE72|nr:hypothetical protein [uncultured Shewanella sp.]